MRVDAAHQHLDERAGQLLLLPRRGLFAGAQPQHHIAHPRRLTGLQRNVVRFAISLVQDADHRNALRHRRSAIRDRRRPGIDRFDGGTRRLVRHRQILLDDPGRLIRRLQRAIAEPAADPQHRDQHGRGKPAQIHPSGTQAS
ncbi:hypothetical protein ASG20_09280 [Sphingomonas sp. Leaf198]|nr:hypothetical protein ASG20_09280 [Sphingomonas sp. Leaf198]